MSETRSAVLTRALRIMREHNITPEVVLDPAATERLLRIRGIGLEVLARLREHFRGPVPSADERLHVEIGAADMAAMRMQAVALAFQWFTAREYTMSSDARAFFLVRASDFGFRSGVMPGRRIRVTLTFE